LQKLFKKAGEIKKEAMDKKAIKISPDNQPVTPPHEPQRPGKAQRAGPIRRAAFFAVDKNYFDP
jgi:hypothetical protein